MEAFKVTAERLGSACGRLARLACILDTAGQRPDTVAAELVDMDVSTLRDKDVP
jgi:hypothetical protein